MPLQQKLDLSNGLLERCEMKALPSFLSNIPYTPSLEDNLLLRFNLQYSFPDTLTYNTNPPVPVGADSRRSITIAWVLAD